MLEATLLSQLANELRRNNLMIFVGAGISAGAGLPGWVDLMRPLEGGLSPAKRRRPPDGFELLRLAGEYEGIHGRNALLRHIRDSLGRVDVRPTSVHRLLPDLLPAGALVTTNYDHLLEDAYRIKNAPFRSFVTDADLAYWDASQTQILKLRGDLARPDSMVVTFEDYNTHPLVRPLLHQQLKSLLITKTPLFIGYSHSDPDLAIIRHQIRHQLGVHARRAYSLQFDLTPTQLASWRREHRDLTAYSFDSHGSDKTRILTSFLRRLLTQSKKGGHGK